MADLLRTLQRERAYWARHKLIPWPPLLADLTALINAVVRA